MASGWHAPKISPELRKKLMKYGCVDCGNYRKKYIQCTYDFDCPYAEEFGDHETYQDYLEARSAPSYDLFDRGGREFK